MGEVGREACPGVHFEYEFRQIEFRQAGVHGRSQGRETGRFLHFIEGFDGQVDLIAAADDFDGGVRRHPSGRLAVGHIEAVCQTAEFLFRRCRHTDGALLHRRPSIPMSPQLQRGIVEVANRGQPRLLRGGLRLREHSRAYDIEHIDDIVSGGCFEGMDKGE